MSDHVHELRKQARFRDALRAVVDDLRQEINSDSLPGAQSWRRHIAGRRCLLLECARSLRNKPSEAIAAVQGFANEKAVRYYFPEDSTPLLNTRLAVIEAALGEDLQVDDLEDQLRRAIDAYSDCWNIQLLPVFNRAQMKLSTEPAFVARLPNARFQVVFRSLAAEFGWLHPGLLCVGETIVWLWGNSTEQPPAHRVQTWVLLADKNEEYPNGLVGQLRLQQVPGGCGALYPDPLSAGYLRMAESFQQGIQHAWLQTLGRSVVPCDFDVRWSLEINDPFDGLPVVSKLSGRSAEVAFACGLTALLNGEDLDQHVAVTAMLAEPGTGHGRTTKVGAIDDKLLAQELRRKQIHEILVAQDQPEVTQQGTASPEKTQKGIAKLIPVANLDAAFEHLARWPRLTRHANGQLAQYAQAVLDDRCDPYIVPSLSRKLSERELPPDADAADRRQPLTADEIDKLMQGRLPQDNNRVRIFAGSGMGKSMFLVHCEQQIATANRGHLPLRVDRLSEYDWKAKPSDVIESLATKALAPPNLPGGGVLSIAPDGEEQQKIDPAEWCQWLGRLFRQGRVVLLLDALDQTRDHLDGLASFLQSADVRRCPVLLTGRPETLQTRSGAFGKMAWHTLQVDPFDESRQRKFLGPVADLLISTSGEKWDHRPSYDRKQQWADLLEVPLLLHLLRDLARRDELDGLKNREAVYSRAVTHLIDQGWQSLQRTDRADDLLDEVEVWDLLADIGWQMISQENFTAVLQGQSFQAVRKQHRGFLRALQQVDITTLQSVFDRPSELGLTWRHLSFCEFFAGCRLAELDRNEQTAVVQQHARDPQWQWVFRFALSRAARDTGTAETATGLALDLIRYGNPFLVYDAIDRDAVTLPERCDRLCRWLVHRDWSAEPDYHDAWDASWTDPVVDAATLDLLDNLFQRQFRNSRCLEPAWELLTESSSPRAETIRASFLGEFASICDNPQADGYQTALDLQQGFVRCPADPGGDGRPFWMGSPDDVGEADEHPRHPVIVSPFQMQQTQVTNAQFELFDPSHRVHRDDTSPDDDTPAIYVNWFMAKMYCLWLGKGYRLPTEAEWEYACRAGGEGEYCFGDDESQLKECAWYQENSDSRAHPVGQLKPNAWGLYDMHGNVWEWCQDWYATDYSASLPIDKPAVNPPGPAAGSSRVLRGGGWFFAAGECRSARRSGGGPVYRSGYRGGFRVVR